MTVKTHAAVRLSFSFVSTRDLYNTHSIIPSHTRFMPLVSASVGKGESTTDWLWTVFRALDSVADLGVGPEGHRPQLKSDWPLKCPCPVTHR